jgi:hypothetical protein
LARIDAYNDCIEKIPYAPKIPFPRGLLEQALRLEQEQKQQQADSDMRGTSDSRRDGGESGNAEPFRFAKSAVGQLRRTIDHASTAGWPAIPANKKPYGARDLLVALERSMRLAAPLKERTNVGARGSISRFRMPVYRRLPL